MKWILFLLVFNYGYSQIINIPDANFKYLLVHSSINNNTALDCVTGSSYKIDLNNDGEIQESEVLMVCRLNLHQANISDLTGIEKFTNLTQLGCGGNNLTSLDLSQLIHLEGLGCYYNQITALDISNLPNLKNLFFQNNQISNIDFSNNPQLEVVYCGNNSLASLDFSNNPLFHDLGCKNNPNLTTININNGATQIFGASTWVNECWTGLPSLTTICADVNEIPALKTYLTGCGVDLSGINISSNCGLGVEEFASNELVLYPNPATSSVNINSIDNIKTIELIDVQGRVLISKEVNSTNATIDVSNYSNGVYFIKINTDIGSKIEKIIKE